MGHRWCGAAAVGMMLLAAGSVAGCIVAAGAGVYGGYKLGTDPRSAGEMIDDGVITAKVKAKLVEEPHIRAFNVDVDTLGGEVTLSGYVASEEQAERAMTLAAGVHGVAKVVSQLKIKP